MGASGGGSTQTVQKADPWEGAQPYLKDMFQQSQGLYQSGALGNLPFPAQRVAPLTPAEETAAEGLNQFGQTPIYQNIMQGLGQTFAQGTGQQPVATAGAYAPMGQGSDVMMGFNPQQFTQGIGGQDPRTQTLLRHHIQQNMSGQPDYDQVQALTEAATRPAMRQFQEQVLPSIGHQAVAAGQRGGSREGVAQGIAARGLTDLIGDTSTRIAEAERQRALQTQMQAMGLGSQQGLQGKQLGLQGTSAAANLGLSAEQMRASQGLGLGQLGMQQQQLAAGMGPQLANMAIMPYQTMLQGGGLQRQNVQNQITDLAGRFDQLQGLPRESLMNYASIISPGAGLGSQSSSTQQNQGSLGQGLMAGSTGALGMAAMTGNPWLIGGAGLAGLLGGMM